MKRILPHFLSAVLLFYFSSVLHAQQVSKTTRQQVPAESEHWEFSLDLSGIALGLNFAFKRKNHRRFGINITLGGEYMNLAVANQFFATHSFREKKRINTTYHGLAFHIFSRTKKTIDFEHELGLRLSVYYHVEEIWREDWETRKFGGFMGVYFQPMIGNGLVKVGSRLALGTFNGNSVGLEITPIIRFNFNKNRNN